MNIILVDSMVVVWYRNTIGNNRRHFHPLAGKVVVWYRIRRLAIYYGCQSFVLKIIKPWEVTDFSALETAERPINRGPEVKIVTSHGERT